MRIKVFVLDKKAEKFKKIAASSSRRLSNLLSPDGIIEVFLIDDVRMKHLNKRFRNKNKPTNVLSFRKPAGFPGKELGEVYLNPVYITTHKENLNLMLIHGVLHILGYDHEERSDRIRMEKQEAKLQKML